MWERGGRVLKGMAFTTKKRSHLDKTPLTPLTPCEAICFDP
jgi:hypothetical protein